MGARVFVDNLPLGTTEEALRALFARDGRTVTGVSIMTDRQSGESHGYAFVEMATHDDAARAVRALNGHALTGGERLHVSAARERSDKSKAGL